MKRTALIIDDDINGLSAVGRVLASDGYLIATALTAEIAWQLLLSEKFDAVICDEQLPGMQGSEFLAAVAERCPKAIRVLVSGHAEVIEREQFVRNATLFRFLQKPCSAAALRKILDEPLASRESAPQSAPRSESQPDSGPLPRAERDTARTGFPAAQEPPVRMSRTTESLLRGALDLSDRVRQSGTMKQVTGGLRRASGRMKRMLRHLRETEAPGVKRDPRRPNSVPPK